MVCLLISNWNGVESKWSGIEIRNEKQNKLFTLTVGIRMGIEMDCYKLLN